MAKLTLNNTAGGFSTKNNINANNDLIEAAVENTLSRDGTTPNSMSAALDMGSNKIINLANASANQEAVTKAQLDAYASNTLTSYNAAAGTFNPAGYTSQTIENKLKETVSVKDYGAVGDGITDDTTAISNAVNSGGSAVFFPPGTYIIDVGEIDVPDNVVLWGVRGASILKGGPSFTTSYASAAAYKTFFKVINRSNVHFRGLSFRLNAPSSSQAKVRFEGCSQVSIVDFDDQENKVWDFLFNNCSDVIVSNFHIVCGDSGVDYGVGIRVCNKSTNVRVFDGIVRGALVTQDATGAGVQPGGDRWGSVGINVDNGSANHQNSTGFKGGMIRFASDGTSTMTWTIPGLTTADWKAWVVPDVDYATPASASVRRASVAITTDTITVSGLPGGPPLNYKVMYTYWGTTPEDVTFDNVHVDGMTYAGISVINGIRVSVQNCTFRRVGDVGFDPEGALEASSLNCTYHNCVSAGLLAPGYRARAIGNTIIGGTQGIGMDASSGAAYQSFNRLGKDYGTEQYKAAITVAAPSGSLQTLSAASGTPFRYTIIGDRVTVQDGGADYAYVVTAKTDGNTITVDNTQCWNMLTPESTITHVIPTGSVTSANWWKTGYAPPVSGLTGDQVVGSNVIDSDGTGVNINIRYGFNCRTVGNTCKGTDRALVALDSTHVRIEDNSFEGIVSLEDVIGYSIVGGSFANGYQRALTLRRADFGRVESVDFTDIGRSGTTAVNPIVVGESNAVVITNNLFGKVHGDSNNGTMEALEGKYDRSANTVDTVSPGNTNILVERNASFDGAGGTYEADNVISFTDGDTTPTVALSSCFKTANTAATTITMFDSGIPGKRIVIFVADANTTFDFTASNLKGNGGVDYVAAIGDVIMATFDGTDWYCVVGKG